MIRARVDEGQSSFLKKLSLINVLTAVKSSRQKALRNYGCAGLLYELNIFLKNIL